MKNLSWNQALIFLAVLGVFLLLAGLVIIRARGGDRRGESVVRSWLAISLVGGLILAMAPAMALADTQLASTIVGGVAASAGSAVAFYFASKSADQARADILGATFGTGTVPDVSGSLSVEEATRLLQQNSLAFVADPASPTGSTVRSTAQSIPAGTGVTRGTKVTVSFQEPSGNQAGGGQDPPAGGQNPPGDQAGGGQNPPAPPAGGQNPPAPPAGGQNPPAPPAGDQNPPGDQA